MNSVIDWTERKLTELVNSNFNSVKQNYCDYPYIWNFYMTEQHK